MTSSPHADTPRDVPNLGFVRPPLVYLTFIAVGVIVHLVRPASFFPERLAMLVGAALIAFAVVLLYLSVARFRAAGTPVPAYKPTTAIVRHGPYRFTRNPIYLGFSLLHLGVAIWVNSLWLLGTLAMAILVMDVAVIRKEEQYLEGKFGAEYLDYKTSVRRWL